MTTSHLTNRIRGIGFGILLSLALVTGLTKAAEKAWVSSYDAKLKAGKSATSETIAILSLGTELSVISFDGRWYEVSTGTGRKGWLYRGKVSSTPPEPGTTQPGEDHLGKLLSGITDSGIKEDTPDTSRSIRPLSVEKDKKEDQGKNEAAYPEALNQLLSRKVTASQVDRFLQEGKIGEYAE
ncbi:MAG: SH3 domain-containing protein [Thermodesulfobacteriota bacterium]